MRVEVVDEHPRHVRGRSAATRVSVAPEGHHRRVADPELDPPGLVGGIVEFKDRHEAEHVVQPSSGARRIA